jgi:hypothetical protein
MDIKLLNPMTTNTNTWRDRITNLTLPEAQEVKAVYGKKLSKNDAMFLDGQIRRLTPRHYQDRPRHSSEDEEYR